MKTNKIILLFFFCLSSCYANAVKAKTENVDGKLNVDGSLHEIDGVYEISACNITFKLTE
jgi:hypothetical protein